VTIVKTDISNKPYVKELKDMLDERPSVKEINFKIETLGVIRYFGIVCQEYENLDPQICEDCGKEIARYTRVMGGWRDKEDKPVWKIICDKCVKAYKS